MILLCLDSLIGVPESGERFNNLLEVALGRQETACIEMRRLYRQLKNKEDIEVKASGGSVKEICGEISVTPEGWVHIKLNALFRTARLRAARSMLPTAF